VIQYPLLRNAHFHFRKAFSWSIELCTQADWCSVCIMTMTHVFVTFKMWLYGYCLHFPC